MSIMSLKHVLFLVLNSLFEILRTMNTEITALNAVMLHTLTDAGPRFGVA
jgi:hypothetical protein